MDLREQDILGPTISDHWYYRSKARAMAAMLGGRTPRSILDIGAGSGFFARALLRQGAERAVCVDPNYPEDRDETEAGHPIQFRREIPATDAELLLLMDVLEHVDDDAGLLRSYTRIAQPGATVLITVPAFQWLWSGHDVFLDHRRRYTLPRLEEVAREAGITVERSAYFFGGVFPLAATLRIPAALRRALTGHAPESKCELRRHGAATNAILETICRVELPLFPYNRFFGLSAFLRGRID